MRDETHPALTLHAIGEGIYNDNLGSAILSMSEREILDPSLLAASMATQFGLLINAVATHNFNGGDSLEDAIIVQERAGAVFTLATIFCSQADLALELINNKRSNIISLHGGDA